MKMKARDIRQLTVQELETKALNLEEELFNMRFQASMGQLSNPLRIRIARKDVARTKTVLAEKKRGEKPAVKEPATAAHSDAPKVPTIDAPQVAAKKVTKKVIKKGTKEPAKKATKKATKKAKKE
jgi:large subunit ribosomal protein L29